MTNMSLRLLVPIIAVALSLSFTTVAGDGCPGAQREMTMEAACREAAGTGSAAENPHHACMAALRRDFRDGSVQKASEYAYATTDRALLEFPGSRGWAEYLLEKPTLTADERATYQFVVGSYTRTLAAMERIRNTVTSHCRPDLAAEYKKALHEMTGCRDRVLRLPSSSLLKLLQANYDTTLGAYVVGKLLGLQY
ncbi:hypothetical protein BS78_07G025900 [Paspalum vaginatum]|nr:hypothetical protein BS78_07G025900 [Paspalum vaginatum]